MLELGLSLLHQDTHLFSASHGVFPQFQGKWCISPCWPASLLIARPLLCWQLGWLWCPSLHSMASSRTRVRPVLTSMTVPSLIKSINLQCLDSNGLEHKEQLWTEYRMRRASRVKLLICTLWSWMIFTMWGPQWHWPYSLAPQKRT
jgi:hypothetical protein